MLILFTFKTLKKNLLLDHSNYKDFDSLNF